MKQRIVMFDFDGVIADSFDVFYHAVVRTLREFGYSCVRNPGEFRDLFEGNFYRSLQRLQIGRQDVDEILTEVGRKVQLRLGDMPLFDGIPAALAALSAAGPLYVITSNQGTAVEAYLERVGLRACFRDVLGVEAHPSKIQKIGLVRRLHPRQSLVYVGDTVGDLREARSARVQTAAVTWGWHDHDQLAREAPDFLLTRPSDLLRLAEPSAPAHAAPVAGQNAGQDARP